MAYRDRDGRCEGCEDLVAELNDIEDTLSIVSSHNEEAVNKLQAISELVINSEADVVDLRSDILKLLEEAESE